MSSSLRDSINVMKQGPDYKEDKPANKSEADKLNDEMSGKKDEATEKKRSSPFKKKKKEKEESEEGSIDKIKILKIGGIIAGIIIFVVGFYFVYTYITKDRGTAWMQEIEEGTEVPPFQYSLDERQLLRVNGYTADDIERYEIEERDPYLLVREAEAARQALYEAEIQPYLDGESEQFKELKSLTWVGLGEMSSEVFSASSYESKYGTYNCDYIKIPAYGSQLYLKLDVMDLGIDIFMTVTPERYATLDDTGNIVVKIDYNAYSNGSIVVTNVSEKDIKK